jgi:hypothetical protein
MVDFRGTESAKANRSRSSPVTPIFLKKSPVVRAYATGIYAAKMKTKQV